MPYCRDFPATTGILRDLVVTPNFTESVAESVDYGRSMKFDFLYIKGAYETPTRTKKGIAESAAPPTRYCDLSGTKNRKSLLPNTISLEY